MPGPNGEECQTCYFFDALPGGQYGLCRHDNAEAWIARPGSPATGNWPRVRPTDWSGDWRDRNSPATNFLATGAAVTPAGTSFSIPSGNVWTYFNPAGIYDGTIMYNVTRTDGTLDWSIPGTFPPGTQFIADYAVFGSITYPSSATNVQWTLGDNTNTPYNTDVIQRIDVTNQTDDISLPFGFAGGPALSTQTGNVRVIASSQTAETVTVNSLYFQIRITVP